MDILEKILNLLLNGSDFVLEYSYKDGKESMKLNGKDLSFDDTETKEIIKQYKSNIQRLDDCVFVEVMEKIGDIVDIKELSEMINKESFTEEESRIVIDWIKYISNSIVENLEDKVKEFNDMIELFNQ